MPDHQHNPGLLRGISTHHCGDTARRTACSLSGRIFGQIVASDFSLVIVINQTNKRTGYLTKALATSLSIVDGHNEDDLVNFRRDGVQFNFQRFIITIALTGAVIAGVRYGTVG